MDPLIYNNSILKRHLLAGALFEPCRLGGRTALGSPILACAEAAASPAAHFIISHHYNTG